MEELLKKYGVNLNDYSGKYDWVLFMCKQCASQPAIRFDGDSNVIDDSRIKVIIIDECDCNHTDICRVQLNSGNIETSYTVTIEETIAQEFQIVAADAKTAFEMAQERYKNGEITLAPGEVHKVRVGVNQPDGTITDWTEI